MYSAYCPNHQSDVLLGHSALMGLANTEVGIIILLECTCGEHIAQLTGVPDNAAALERHKVPC